VTNFLFWNINRRPIQDLIVSLALQERVDVLILAECEIEVGPLLLALNTAMPVQFDFPVSQSESAKVFTRFSRDFLRARAEGSRYSIRELNLPGTLPILMTSVHLPSKQNSADDSQILESTELARAVRDQESRTGHGRSLIVGDFNMNPFEAGMVGASGLHATMDRTVALRGSRTIRGRDYPFFYNPMWNYFGDENKAVPGTHYYARNEQKVYFWNMFDQVLLRPELIPSLQNPGVRIITAVAGVSLLSSVVRPDKRVGSDHLPILFHWIYRSLNNELSGARSLARRYCRCG